MVRHNLISGTPIRHVDSQSSSLCNGLREENMGFFICPFSLQKMTADYYRSYTYRATWYEFWSILSGLSSHCLDNASDLIFPCRYILK